MASIFRFRGILFLFCEKDRLRMVNTGWHHEQIVPDILAYRLKCPGFFDWKEIIKHFIRKVREHGAETDFIGRPNGLLRRIWRTVCSGIADEYTKGAGSDV